MTRSSHPGPSQSAVGTSSAQIADVVACDAVSRVERLRYEFEDEEPEYSNDVQYAGPTVVAVTTPAARVQGLTLIAPRRLATQTPG
jgi:hypothetical protein